MPNKQGNYPGISLNFAPNSAHAYDILREVPRSFPSALSALCMQVWGDEENKALIEFVLFHCDPAVWPSHKKASKFWSDAANFVQQRSKAPVKRTGS